MTEKKEAGIISGFMSNVNGCVKDEKKEVLEEVAVLSDFVLHDKKEGWIEYVKNEQRAASKNISPNAAKALHDTINTNNMNNGSAQDFIRQYKKSDWTV